MYGSYRTLAGRFGLTMTPAEPSIFTTVIELAGDVQNHPVHIRRLIGTHTLETEVHLRPALDLGLDLTPAGQPPHPGPFGSLRWIGKLFSRADLHVGDTELDEAFAVHGDEEARVRTLLEPLRDSLLAWHQAQRHFHVTDSFVSVRRYSPSPFQDDVADIAGDLDGAIDLAARVERGRPTLPPALALEPQVRAFETFATARGIEALVVPLVVWGSLRGRPFWARARRVSPNAFELLVSLELTNPVPTPEHGRGFETSLVSGPRWSDEASAALAALRKAGNRVSLSERGLYIQSALGSEPYALDVHVASAEAVLDGVEGAFAHHTAYR